MIIVIILILHIIDLYVNKVYNCSNVIYKRADYGPEFKNDIEECLVCADEIEAYGIIKDRMTTTFRENVRYEMLKLLAYIGYGNGFFPGRRLILLKKQQGLM